MNIKSSINSFLTIILSCVFYLMMTSTIKAQVYQQTAQKSDFWQHERFGGGLGLNFGNNFTTYDYKNSLGNTNSSLRSGEGSFYQLGLDFKLNKATDKLSYAVSVVYNQFNAEGGTSTANYSWKTNYLGIQNALNYTLFQ